MDSLCLLVLSLILFSSATIQIELFLTSLHFSIVSFHSFLTSFLLYWGVYFKEANLYFLYFYRLFLLKQVVLFFLKSYCQYISCLFSRVYTQYIFFLLYQFWVYILYPSYVCKMNFFIWILLLILTFSQLFSKEISFNLLWIVCNHSFLFCKLDMLL